MTNQDVVQESPLLLGDILKANRVERGISLDDAANNLRISKRHLNQFENNSEEMPCNVYTLGFLKQYAAYLKLDAEPLVKQFKDKSSLSSLNSLSFPAPLPGRGRPNWKILSLCFLALLTIILAWVWVEYQTPLFEAFQVSDFKS